MYAFECDKFICNSLQWRHNGCDGVSNHQRLDCLLSRLFRFRSKKTSKRRIIGLCARDSLATGEFPAPTDSNAENVSIWWRHHVLNEYKGIRSRIIEISILFLPFSAADKMVLLGSSMAKLSLLKLSFLIKTQPGVTGCGFRHIHNNTHCFKMVDIATGNNFCCRS